MNAEIHDEPNIKVLSEDRVILEPDTKEKPVTLILSSNISHFFALILIF
jgi:hypothetical protein